MRDYQKLEKDTLDGKILGQERSDHGDRGLLLGFLFWSTEYETVSKKYSLRCHQRRKIY